MVALRSGIAPRELAGLTVGEYSSSGLADEVLGHMEQILIREQREAEKQSGKPAQRPPRKRPTWKEKSDAER